MSVSKAEDWRAIAAQFQERWNFPHCLGAIDGKHVVIQSPCNSGSLFFNYKSTYSLVLLAVVDADYLFKVVDVGGFGRTSDSGSLRNSAFDESAYRWEIYHLVTWCGQNNLELNALKTVQMGVDFRKNPAPANPITLSASTVVSGESIRVLGTIISQDLKWELNIISLTKKAHQRMYFLRQLKKFN